MARLPQPGGDNGNWGTILNDYLSQALKTDGTIKDNAVTNAAIAPGAVTSSEIATDAVGATQIADGSITETLLATAVQTKLNAGGGTPDWSTITNKPTVIAAGADQVAARAAIGAGMSNLAIGTTNTTAKAGNYTPTATDVGLGSVDNTSDANKPISTAMATALSGKAATSHTHTALQISDSTATGRSLVTAANAAAARTAIGIGGSPGNVYYVAEYGLVGDWTGGDATAGSGTNDTSALNTLISTAPTGSTIIFDGTKNYRLDPVSITKTLIFDFNSAGIVTKTSASLSSAAPLLYFESTFGTAYALGTGGFSLGASSVTTATAANAGNFAANDQVMIYGLEPFTKWDGTTAPSGTIGEVNIVDTVNASTGVVTLKTPLAHGYASTTLKIQKIATPNSSKVRNVGMVIDTDPGGASTGGLAVGAPPSQLADLFSFYGCIDPRVETVKAVGWQGFVMNFNLCLRPRSFDVTGIDPFRPASGGHGYVSRMTNCVDGEYVRSIGYGTRHVCGYVSSARCGSRDCAAYRMVGAAYETHGAQNRDIHSINDSYIGGATEGWAFGNDSFSSDYNMWIERPTYYGTGNAIEALSASVGLRVIDPNIHTSGMYGIHITEACVDTLIDLRSGVIENTNASASAAAVSLADTSGTGTFKPSGLTVYGSDSSLVGTNSKITGSIVGKVILRDIPPLKNGISGAYPVDTDGFATATHAQTSKATPVDADEIPLVDSAAASQGKKLTWANLKTTLGVATATASTLAQRDSSANLVADAFIPGSTSTTTAAGTTTLTVDSTETQIFTGTSTQTVILPTTNVVAGQRYTIINLSTGIITIQSSGANTVISLNGISSYSVTVTALVSTPTTAANWLASFRSPLLPSTLTGGSTNIAQRTNLGTLAASSFVPSLTTTATAAGTTTLSAGNAQIQVFTGSSTQTVTLPTTSISAGQPFKIINTSSGALTINSSGGNLVKTLAAGSQTEVTALIATPTTAVHWFAT